MKIAGHRKFIVAVLSWASSTALCAAGRVDGGEYVALIGLILSLFGAANAVERLSTRGAP